MLYKLKIYGPLILILGVVGYYLLKLLLIFIVGYQVHEPRQLEKQEYLYSLNAGVEFQDSLFTIIVLDYLPKNKVDSLCYLEAQRFFMTDTSFNKRDYCLYFFNDTKEIYYIEREASEGIYLTAYYSCNKKYISIFELEEREKIRIANKFDNEIINSYLIKKYPYLEAK